MQFKNKIKIILPLAVLVAYIVIAGPKECKYLDEVDLVGDTEELQHYEGVIERSAGNNNVWQHDLLEEAAQYLVKGDAASAEIIYRKIVDQYPSDLSAHENLGVCLSFQQKYDQAREEYLKVLKISPMRTSALYKLACVEYETGNNTTAEMLLKKSLLSNNNYSSSHRLLGIIYYETDRHDLALHHLHRAFELNPGLATDSAVVSILELLETEQAEVENE